MDGNGCIDKNLSTNQREAAAVSSNQQPAAAVLSNDKQRHIHTWPDVCVGMVLGGRWQLKGQIGTGGFAKVFLAEDLVTGRDVAVKAQTGSAGNALKLEADVLLRINGRFAPKLFHYGGTKESPEDQPPYLVMELMRGDDMSELRHRQATFPRVPLKAGVQMVKEITTLLEQLHDLGVIHRDVKLNNFMRRSRHDKSFCVIDFGIARFAFDRHGQLRPEREKAEFRGTTLFASPRSHQGKDLGRSDDLVSAFFVLLDLMLGRAPWGEQARIKNKAAVHDMKEEYMRNPAKLVEEDPFLSARSDRQHITGALCAITHYLNALKFEDRPDYDEFRSLLDDLAAYAHPEESEGFDWVGNDPSLLSSYQRAKLDEEAAQHDTAAKRAAIARQVHFGLCVAHRRLSLSDGRQNLPILPNEEQLCKMWARVTKRVLGIQEHDADRLMLLKECYVMGKKHKKHFSTNQSSASDNATSTQMDVFLSVERALRRALKKARLTSPPDVNTS